MELKIEQLSFAYDERTVIENIQMDVKNKSFVGVIGPNGGGKSTVLKQIYRALQPDYGDIWIDGRNLKDISYKEFSQKISVVGQEHEMPFDFQTWEIVAMGRSPHKKLFEQDSDQDRETIGESLDKLNIGALAHQNYQHLSGGEKQRVLIARMLAQQAECMILDEPTNHLDVRYQLEIFQLLKELEVTVIAAIHDLNIAALYCDLIYIIKDGRISHAGTPEELFTPEILYEVYGIHTDITIHNITGRKHITYLPPERKHR